jgi:hypothetical protein
MRITNPHMVEPDFYMDLSLNLGPCEAVSYSDDELRIGWRHHRDRLMGEAMDSKVPGRRPWAWWQFEAGRPEHLTPYPSLTTFEGTGEE